MLIFILPSSLYLKITQQDGSKLTQRIWVCIPFRSMQRFDLVIPYNVPDVKRNESEHTCELLHVTFHPCFSQLAAVLALLLCLPWGSPRGGAERQRAPCLLGCPSLQGEGLSSWLASGSSAAAVAVSRVWVPTHPPAPASSPFSPARLLHFTALIQKACDAFRLGIPRGFN